MAGVFRVGVTGGIGSGKTTVCSVFSTLNIPVFSADTEARNIMESDARIREGINSIAGRDLYSTGSLNRSELASIIFNDPVRLKKINALVHPAVFSMFESWVTIQKASYSIMEAAILFESEGYKYVDKTISVIAPEEERIQRVMLRNNLTREQILDRMRNQLTDEKRIELSDYIISNSENEMIIPVILGIHNEILKLTE